ncbi:hypothetical protein [Enterococcus phage vB_Efs6_KEN03]
MSREDFGRLYRDPSVRIYKKPSGKLPEGFLFTFLKLQSFH